VHQAVELGKHFRIADKRWLSDRVFSIWVEAPDIAAAFEPGQFVIVRPDDTSERIPLTIAGTDREKSCIRLIVQVVGGTTRLMSRMPVSSTLLDVVGPLGRPIEVKRYPGPIIGVAGGLGAAPLLPQLVSYREAGNRIICILGARTLPQLLLMDELQNVAHELHITTDDGSYIRKGLVTDVLLDVLDNGTTPSLIIAIGPPIMMKATCELAVRRGLPVMASLNPIMVDGTGMCGGCRVTVNGQTYFACVDGPDFDGSRVNWDELMARLDTYRPQERIVSDHSCKIGRGRVVA
jgi:ferredoxin/flavodoxin---NADP+ reductase